MKKHSMLGARPLSSLKLFLVTTLVAAGILISPAGMASATAPVWSDPINLSPATTNIQNQDPKVAMSDDGQIQIAVWLNQDLSPASLQESHTLDGGDTWSNPANVGQGGADCQTSETGVDVFGLCSPDVAMNSDGTVTTVVWIYNDAIQAGTIDLTAANPSWTMDQISSSDERVFEPQISMSNDGQLQTAVWRWEDHGASIPTSYAVEIQTSSSVNSGATWSSEETLANTVSSPGVLGLMQPDVSVSGDGSTQSIVWVNSTNTAAIVYGEQNDFDGTSWGPWRTIESEDGNSSISDVSFVSYYPQISVSDDGFNQTVTWQEDGAERVLALSTDYKWVDCNYGDDCDLVSISDPSGEIVSFEPTNPGPQLTMSGDGEIQAVTFLQTFVNDDKVCIQSGELHMSLGNTIVSWWPLPECAVANLDFPMLAMSSSGQVQTLSALVDRNGNGYFPTPLTTEDNWVTEAQDFQNIFDGSPAVSDPTDGAIMFQSSQAAISMDGSHQTMIWVLQSGVVQVVTSPYTAPPTPPSPGPNPNPAPELADTGLNGPALFEVVLGAFALGFASLLGAVMLRRRKR